MSNTTGKHTPCMCTTYMTGDAIREEVETHIKYCPLHEHAPELLEALKGLVEEVKLSKLNIRKDFSLINAHAYATKAIYKAMGGQP